MICFESSSGYVIAGQAGYIDLERGRYISFKCVALAKSGYPDRTLACKVDGIHHFGISNYHHAYAGIQYKVKGPFVVDVKLNDNQVADKLEAQAFGSFTI